MKQIYKMKNVVASMTMGFLFLLMQVGFAQTDNVITVDPEEYIENDGEYRSETPEFFLYRGALTANEIHLLDTLTREEREIIESAFEPPAFGVVRYLENPISFDLRSINIPAEGEVSTMGGRLARVDNETLVYTTYFQSKNADELRIFFSKGFFPEGVKVNIFSGDQYAFTQRRLTGEIDEYGFYTTSVDADNLTLQAVIPVTAAREGIYFEITAITHVDTGYLPEGEEYRWCTEDANCSYANEFANINGLRSATARLSWPVGGGYVGYCSGSLLNDIRTKDLQPYLLTANHCFSTQTDASALEARFEYWSTSCNSGVVNPNNIIVNGANLIITNPQSDVTMVLMKEKPAGSRHYLGWTTNNPANNETLHTTNHPGGTLMKYSRHQNKTSPASDDICVPPEAPDLPLAHYHYTRCIGGRTGGGSSGGPVVRDNLHVVGQLYGKCWTGWDHCNYDHYHNVWGKFGVSYSNNNLQYWLYNSFGAAGVAMSTSPAATLNFGTVNLGSSKNMTVTVTNTGTVPNYLNLEAGIATITGTNANQFSITGPTSLYLAPGESGTFTIRFTPATGGAKTAQLNIPHNADNISSPRVITLNGTGGGTAGLWTGTISTNWHTSGNWQDNNIPNSTTDVLITSSAPYQPVINSWAVCKDLVLQSGATLTHNSSYLDVYGTFDPAYGQYTMTSSSASLWFMGSGNVSWWNDFGNDVYTNVTISKTTSDDIVTMRHSINCSGTFNLSRGKLQMNSVRTLTVNSPSATAFQVGNGGTLILSVSRTLTVAGGIRFNDGSQASVTGGVINCGGNFNVQANTLYDIKLDGATLKMNGSTNQYFQDFDTGTELHHLTIDKSGGTLFIAERNLIVNGDLTILNGQFTPNNTPTPTATFDIYIKGNWANNNFPAGFIPGSGTVFFNGPGHQYVYSNENFNTLVANMGAALRLNNEAHTVICAQYQWISGGIDVLAGTFTALDLAQNGLYGGFWVNPGGTINITNSTGSTWVDLRGSVYILGGTMNLTGTFADWPYANGTSFTMTGGVLDIKTCNFRIMSGYTWTYNITGGTIRIARGFESLRNDFTPAGGTVEFYGTTDWNISQANGSTLHNVIVNKSSKEGGEDHINGPVYDQRSGVLLTDGGKANTIILFSNFAVTGDLDIEAGTLNASNKILYIRGDWTNNVGPTGFAAGTSTVNFEGLNQAKINTAETFYNMTINKTYDAFEGLEIMSVPVTVLNNLDIVDGTLELNSNSVLTIGNNLSIADEAGLNAGIYDFDIEVYLGGNYTNNNAFYNTIQGYTPGGETIIFNGTGDQYLYTAAPQEDFGNFRIDKPSGSVRPTGNLQILGDFEIASGSFSSNTSGRTHYFHGDFAIGAAGNYYPGSPSTTAFYGEYDQSYFNAGGSALFYDFIVDKTASKSVNPLPTSGSEKRTTKILESRSKAMTLTLLSDAVVFGGSTATVTNGTLDLGENNFVVNGTLNINTGGVVIVPSDSRLRLVNGLYVNSGGVLEAIGTNTAKAMVSRNGSSYYPFEVGSGGTIRASYAIFEYMNVNGLNIKPGAIVDATHSFNNCTFRDGAPSPGTLLTIDNNQTFVVSNAEFPNNSWGGLYNVRKAINTGNVTFYNATGDFAGSAFEYDPFNRVHWVNSYLTVNPSVKNVSYLAGTTSFDVESNIDWTVSEGVPWLSVTPMAGSGNGLLSVNYDENLSTSPRSGQITISGNDVANVVITVNQEGSPANYGILAIHPTSLTETHTQAPESTMQTLMASNIGTGTLFIEPEIVYSGGGGENEWIVNVQSAGFGDEVTWELRDNGGVVILSGGPYSPGFNDTQSVFTSNEPLEFYIESMGIYNDNAPAYTVWCSGNVVVSGSLLGGEEATHSGLTCGGSRTEWLSINPVSASLLAGNALPFVTTFNSEGLAEGVYLANINFYTDNPMSPQPEIVVPVELIVAMPLQQTIVLPAGWSGWSSYIDPATDAMFADVVAPVVDNMIITQHFTELFYPAYGINTMGTFSNDHGYVTKMSQADQLVLEGELAFSVVTLTAGWNLMPMLVPCNMDAATVFDNINGLIIAYEVAGNGIYWPGNVITLEELSPGKAYWVKVTASTYFYFPNCPAQSKSSYIASLRYANTTAWNEISYTGSSHIVVFDKTASNLLVEGDAIGAFTSDGSCAGITIYDGSQAALAIFGDDITTETKDGFSDGEPLSFRLFRQDSQTEYFMDVTYGVEVPNYDGLFENHGLSLVSDISMSPTGFNSIEKNSMSIYPNPSDGLFNVIFYGLNNEINYRITDSRGLTVSKGQLKGSQVIDLSRQPSGVYFIIFEEIDILPQKLIIN
jgi:hypothetical protein